MKFYQERILKILLILIWSLALIHMTAEYYYLYWTVRWFDMVTHFFGGLWVGIAAIWVWNFSGYIRKLSMPGKNGIYIALLASLFVGIIWEAYEYGVWQWSGTGLPLNYVPDSILDLVMDVAGACTGFFILKKMILGTEEQLETITT